MCEGKDWFSDFMKIKGDIALKEPESLPRTRAQKPNNKAVDDFFSFMRNLRTALNIRDEPRVIFNMDETGVFFNNVPPKIVATKVVKILRSSPVLKGLIL
jgi:hypothetical protein